MDSKIYGLEHSFFELKRVMSGLVAKYPFITLSSVGRSVAGRDIISLSVGSGEEYTLFVTGADPTFRITTLILLKFIEEVAYSTFFGKEMCNINIRKAMFGRGIIIIPLLNPDGTEIALRGEMGCGYMAGKISKMCKGDFENWSANLRGVDILKNLSPEFKKLKDREIAEKKHFPTAKGFCGYKPDSEPEGVALLELCKSKPITNLIYLGGFGGSISYSGYPKVPESAPKMAEIMSAVSGYKIIPPISENTSSFAHRFTAQFQKPGITLSVGENYPPPVRELNYHYGRVKEMLTLSAIY